MATVTRPIALVGLHYLRYRHTLYMLYVNITPHVCKGLEAICAYSVCSISAVRVASGRRLDKHLVIFFFIRYKNIFGSRQISKVAMRLQLEVCRKLFLIFF